MTYITAIWVLTVLWYLAGADIKEMKDKTCMCAYLRVEFDRTCLWACYASHARESC